MFLPHCSNKNFFFVLHKQWLANEAITITCRRVVSSTSENTHTASHTFYIVSWPSRTSSSPHCVTAISLGGRGEHPAGIALTKQSIMRRASQVTRGRTFYRSMLLRILLRQIPKRSTSAAVTPSPSSSHQKACGFWCQEVPERAAHGDFFGFRKGIARSRRSVSSHFLCAPAEDTQLGCYRLGFYQPIRIRKHKGES